MEVVVAIARQATKTQLTTLRLAEKMKLHMKLRKRTKQKVFKHIPRMSAVTKYISISCYFYKSPLVFFFELSMLIQRLQSEAFF